MKRTLAITLAAAALMLIAAFATLTVLTAVAGQKSGLEKSRAAHCAAHRGHGAGPAAFVSCRTSDDR